MPQGLELDDFVSGPRELLLKFVEENYPLPEQPEPLSGNLILSVRGFAFKSLVVFIFCS